MVDEVCGLGREKGEETNHSFSEGRQVFGSGTEAWKLDAISAQGVLSAGL